MIEAADGRPEVGRSARKLGVRPGIGPARDIPTDGDYVDPLTGGMSVSREIQHLPVHRRPRAHGGTAVDPLWGIGEEALTEGLVCRDDVEIEGHVFIEPAWRMLLSEYEGALALTRDKWWIYA
jgi:hypothetical protein